LIPNDSIAFGDIMTDTAMAELRLKYDGNEFPLGTDVVTLGRTGDNVISFPGDGNVSRYHAEIEYRYGDYVLIDLNSSNGTTVNGTKVTSEVFLKEGDIILLGGSAEIVFGTFEEAEEGDPEVPGASVEPAAGAVAGSVPSAPAAAVPAVDAAAFAAPSGGPNLLFIIAGAVCLLAVVFVAAAAAVYLLRPTSCTATVEISSPGMGEIFSKPVEIILDIADEGCVYKAVYTLDGIEAGTSDTPPFEIELDPARFPELADGLDHALAVTLFDEAGNVVSQSKPVLIGFETLAIEKPKEEIAAGDKKTGDDPKTGGVKEVSLIDIQEMASRLAKQFSGGEKYNVSNKQFLQEIQKRTAEYAQAGYSEKALKYRDAINVAFVREQNLDAPLGFVLAMSRSKFEPGRQGQEEGLWRMTQPFVSENKYDGLCGAETISSPPQNCAAMASALYLKALIFSVFDGDVLYSVAAFGKTLDEAGDWKARLPQNRVDIGNAIKTAPEREQLIRFFAAGIVAENPQKFGLAKDRPLSELYRLTM
jgi:pSer/pThr/pTyr-binding forkhead associated (FHA) protein